MFKEWTIAKDEDGRYWPVFVYDDGPAQIVGGRPCSSLEEAQMVVDENLPDDEPDQGVDLS